ncbi:FkbM family methyltransferase [Polymorphobacter arshaanensis]|nr:FkbM family methyltransferase [Polymorphobacter arshaanensis]
MPSLFDNVLALLRYKASLLSVPRAIPRVIQTETNGYVLLVRANEEVGRAIHFVGNFEIDETAFLRSVLRPDSVCIDIGANVGYFTMLMAQIATNGSVHAFEPLPLNAALLTASAELNRFENIQLNQCAVGGEDGTVSFAQAEDSAYSSIRDTNRKSLARMLTVPIVRLDSYAAQHGLARIDVLKADVEGAEGMILAGATGLLGDPARRPRVMMIELYEPSLAIFDTSIAQVMTSLAGYGYVPHVIGAGGALRPYDRDRDVHKYNIVFQVA